MKRIELERGPACLTANWTCPLLQESNAHNLYCGVYRFYKDDEPPEECPNVLALKAAQEEQYPLVAVTEATYRAIMRQRGIGAARGEE